MLRTNTLPESPSPPASFQGVVEQHKRSLYALAYDLTGSHHDAEDLSQEVFLKAYRARHRFRGEAQLSTWLYRITVNTYLNQRRKKVLRFRTLWDDFSDTPRPAEATDRQAEASAMRAHVEAALAQLSPRERSAFVLRHYHEMPLKEIAATMEISDGTVKSLLFRAARKLRTALAFYREDLGLEQ